MLIPVLNVTSVTAGSFTISIANASSTSALAGNLVIAFLVL